MKTVGECEGCEGCPIRNKFPESIFVEPIKRPGLRVAIGPQPLGEDAPFSEGAANWFKVLYKKAGIDTNQVSELNVIQCRPEGLPKDVFPTDAKAKTILGENAGYSAVQQCAVSYVHPFLHSRPWERIDSFGEAALQAVTGKSGIDRWRGSPLAADSRLEFTVRDRNIGVPTLDLNTLGSNQNMVPIVVNDLRKTLAVEPEQYNIYPSLDDVKKFTAKEFAFDIETNRWNSDQVYMVGLSASPYESIVVPFTDEYIPELKRIFADATDVIGQNCIQFDLPILERKDIRVNPDPRKCRVWDIMLLHHLRFPSFPHGLEFIGRQFTNKGSWKSDKESFETYCARDTDVTFRSYKALRSLVDAAGLLRKYLRVSWPLARIARRMHVWGFKRSAARLKTLREQYLVDIEKAQALLPEELRTRYVTKNKREIAPEGTVSKSGKPLKFIAVPYQEEVRPWKSAVVKMKFLYTTLNLPPQVHYKTKKPTTDKIALDKLVNRLQAPSQELIKRVGGLDKVPEILQWVRAIRDLNEKSTRLSGFAKDEEIPEDTIHPYFNVHGTETGRFSSSEPNAQNIPAEARFMFVPRVEGGRIISLDYSGIENRLVAYLARDKRRLKWFESEDFSEHKYLAAILEGIPYDEVVKSKDKDSWYAIAKTIVHGADRMRGAKNIWEKNDLDPENVKKVLAIWKGEIADTIRWQKRVADEAQRTGWAANPFGRKLWFWEANSATRVVSFYPQSTAFDVIARAMIGLMYERIDWPEEWAREVCPVLCPLPEGSELNFQVHDELVVETVSEELVAPTIETMRTVMEQPWPELGGLKLPVGVGHGLSWGDC